MTGEIISHYRILDKLGEGGMGVVYKAEDLQLGRTVALKFLHAGEDTTRLLREAQAAASLMHPNLCAIFEVDSGRGFLAMELVEGSSLSRKIEERPLKLDEALRLASEIGAGLAAAHEKGIVHRDIKAGNILLTPSGQPKITDFGLALLAGRSRITRSAATVGTPSYMAPEQARGETVDRRADIWSLGIVLYEMVAGRLPFKGDSESAVIHSILHDDPEPLTALRSGLPIDLDRIVGKCLAKDPAERYQHAEDFLVDLRALTRNLESGDRRAAAAERMKPSNPRWWAPRVALPAAALLAVLAFILWRSGSSVSPIDSLAVLPFAVTAPDAGSRYLGEGLTEVLITNLSRLPNLRVNSRDVVARYARQE
jgi:serine/threonine protein kinase